MLRSSARALVGLVVLASSAAGVHASPAPSVPPTAAVASSGSWTVYHHDDGHTGYDSSAPNALGAAAGWVSSPMDDSVYAEPLVFNGLVYAVTLGGTLYAFDQSTGATAWSVNVGTPQAVLTGQCGNIDPLGISGTPVIDTSANRIYVSELVSGETTWRVFGIDLSTHAVVFNVPLPSTVGFDWTIEQERGALALANGYVYVPFGGRAGDCGPYHGWIFAVPVNGGTIYDYKTPGIGAGFWSAGGVVVDDSTGKVFETSGNGTSSGCDANADGTPVYENDAVVRFSATLTHEDAFIPQDWQNHWCTNDQDLGSATMVLINPMLAFQAGKWGSGFLLNPQSLGGIDGQRYPTPKPAAYAEQNVCLGNTGDADFGSYAYAAPYVYLSCEGNGLVALSVNTSTPSFSSCSGTCPGPSWNAPGFSPGPPIVAGGAVWAVDTGGGGLYGFNATTGAQIYHSAGFSVTHFTTPAEAGGVIFVGSDNVIRSFDMQSGCGFISLSASPAGSTTPGTTVTATANATGPNCTSPLYRFWLRPATSNTWTMERDYSTTNTWAWTSTNVSGGYYIGVWAKSSGSTALYDSVTSIPYTITSTPCTGVTISAAPASPVTSGPSVTLTANAAGCPSPLYEFWMRPSTSSTWQVLRAYSPTATYAWSSSLKAGTFYFGAWAKNSSSATSTFEANASMAYTVSPASCASVMISASPPSPIAHGGSTTVIFTALASGCSNPSPLYEFWFLNGSAWQVVQAWSPTATWSWSTTGKPATTYHFGVWVRDASSIGVNSGGSMGRYDAYAPLAYALT